MEVEIVEQGFQGKPFLLFLFNSDFWKMDLMIRAPEAILGLGKKGHKNCRAFAMLSLGLNHCREPSSCRLFLYENRLVLKPL